MHNFYKKSVVFPTHNELYVLDCENVLYIKAEDHYSQVCYRTGARFLLPFGLTSIYEKISQAFQEECCLIRIGRSYIVNIRCVFHINTIKEEIILADATGSNHAIHMSKQSLRILLSMINEHD